MEHHTGATIFRAASHGELRTLADTINTVDVTINIHLTKHLAELPLHRALESGLTTQALGLWMAFRGIHPQDALHIVQQESHR